MKIDVFFINFLISISFMGTILYFIRGRKLREQYSLLWLLLSFIMMILSLFPGMIDWLALQFHVAYAPSLLYLLGLAGILFILLHLTMAVSSLTNKAIVLTQTVALQEQMLLERDVQLQARVEAQVQAQVQAQVEALVEAQVRAQVQAQVEALVEAQMRAQVQAQVQAQVEALVEAQMRAQVQAQVEALVEAQVQAQVETQMQAQVQALMEATMQAQVQAQVEERTQESGRSLVEKGGAVPSDKTFIQEEL
ncbi:hypothetical protein PAECIP111893_00474 [Paenibacillus plantiphilus]|uniref:DUF2304 domain-containing protein n=1 Tax=Paenibacillus plantiphilus TaxID=2905650 RepID=A0ABM9BS85_9BACL|nr:DUF2304 domain-containing protein [Paenibacillus plantiphilus]CAH1193483.1 hypothetical protein PAECIP111893_00474 [Paenibacillus plantiphilus]